MKNYHTHIAERLPPALQLNRIKKSGVMIFLAALSASLITLSFPPYDQYWLAWIAYVPLLIACKSLTPPAAILVGLLSGFLAKNGIHFWIYDVPGFRWYHGALLGLYMGSYTAAWCGVTAFLDKKKLPILVYAPSAWVLLDYLYANAGFLAFPWATLAHGQHNNLPVIQIAQYTGEYGITWLVLFVNAAIALTITEKSWKAVATAATTVLGIYLWGNTELAERLDNPIKTKIAVIQPNTPRPSTPNEPSASFPQLRKLTLAAVKQHPDAIVWPESSVKGLLKHKDLMARVTDLARTTNTPLIIGSSEYRKFIHHDSEISKSIEEGVYNAAWLIDTSGSISKPYKKNLLVPFTEYIPLDSVIPWPDWLIPYIKPITPGSEYSQFAISRDVSAVPLICWETLFPDYVRIAATMGKPNFIAHIVNDNWFGKSAAPVQHNMAAVIRAVENRIPIAVASNTGPSEIIDAYGRVTTQLGIDVPGIAVATIIAGHETTFFTEYGNVFVFLCILQFAALTVDPIRRLSRSQRVK